jgi:hypothetical protein
VKKWMLTMVDAQDEQHILLFNSDLRRYDCLHESLQAIHSLLLGSMTESLVRLRATYVLVIDRRIELQGIPDEAQADMALPSSIALLVPNCPSIVEVIPPVLV